MEKSLENYFPMAPYSNLDTVYSEIFHSIATISTTISFILSLIIQPFYIYVVIRKSPKSMLTFQRLLLCYIFATILFEFGMICLRPLVILPFMAIYPVGFLAPMSVKTGIFLIFLVAIALTFMADFLLSMLAQRYFILISFTLRKRRWITPTFYFFQISTNLAFITFFCCCFYADVLPEPEARYLILTHISGSSQLLIFQPNVIVANYEKLFYSKIAIFAAGLFVGSRAVGFCFFLYRNITLPKHLDLHFSTNARIQHKMLLTAICAQLFGIFLFLILPFFIIILIISIPNIPNSSKAWIILMCWLNNFIIYDSIITIICIKHYRNFFINLFCCLKKSERKVSVLPVTSSARKTNI